MFKRCLIALCVLVIGLAACSPAAATSAPSVGQSQGKSVAPGLPTLNDTSSSGGMPSAAPAEAPAQPRASAFDAAGNIVNSPDRLVIQNAELIIVVDEPPQTMDAVARMATELGGFVVTSNQYKTRTDQGVEVPQANITIRVPAEKLDDALTKIKALTRNPKEDVRSENRSGQDVTKEYTDLQSRLSNLEQTEKQLREIMASAQKTEDVMSVFNQLTQVREQIEVIKGQIKYYEESSALSAIQLQILSQAAVAPLTIGSWKPVGVARDATQALINALKFIANLLIWAGLFLLPIGLIIFLVVWLLIRLLRRFRPRQKPVAPPAA